MTVQTRRPQSQPTMPVYIDEFYYEDELEEFVRFGVKFAIAFLIASFLLCGLYLGYLFRGSVKQTIVNFGVGDPVYADSTTSEVGNTNSILQNIMMISPQRGGEIPAAGITGVTLPDYENKERVNILLLGIDKRPGEKYARSDTIIVITIDPENKTAGMVSIPRDLYLQIPDYVQTRINKAHYYGEKDGYPGGGPALAMRTIQENFGIPIHFYIKVDFNGFREIVDTIGGIDVDVPHAIDDPTFPDNDYGYDPFYISAGQHHLDGSTALKYARTRKTPRSDFGRAERQQQVLVAIKDKSLQFDIIPKIPELWTTAGNVVETDLQLVDVVELAELANTIQHENIEMVVLDESYTNNYTTDAGAMVLVPAWDKIDVVIEQIFAQVQPAKLNSTQRIATQVAQSNREEQRRIQAEQRNQSQNQLALERAAIIVQNGTKQPGLEVTIADFFKKQGFNIIYFGPADLQDYPKTVIVDYSGKAYTLGILTNFFDATPENVRQSPVRDGNVDIRVIIGEDFQFSEGPIDFDAVRKK
ncbi:MAG: hypothetical protein B6242_06050 [Anaerolineaceae bacterium 4572_78]|nr:MAG: hypothetical protein B6242_06050 [Anaerolineaceae bacterium 4572_78]